jgi:hypothetical protein
MNTNMISEYQQFIKERKEGFDGSFLDWKEIKRAERYFSMFCKK